MVVISSNLSNVCTLKNSIKLTPFVIQADLFPLIMSPFLAYSHRALCTNWSISQTVGLFLLTELQSLIYFINSESFPCFSESQSFDLCTDFLERHRSTVYLTSPQYPSPKLSPVKCSCEVKGQNISVHTLEQNKAPLSSVVYIMSIESLTKHITKLQIINRLEFSNISSLWVFLDNRFPEQEFRLWLKLTGTGEFRLSMSNRAIILF